MIHAELPGMKHHASGGDGLARWLGVDRIANEWASEVKHVDADLVSAPGMQVAENERGVV